jgi:predicted Zn-dependent protease
MNRPHVQPLQIFHRSRRLIPSLSCLALFALACATSPMGRKQLLMYNEATMSQLGVQSFDQIRGDMPTSTDAAVNAYVQCVANSVVAALEPSDGGPTSWEVVVFEEPTANAFALPGGKIGVHTGLLEVAENQDQLATVIGHEVGHVLAHHSNERMSQSQMTQLGLAVAGAFAASDGLSDKERTTLALMGLGAQYGVLLPYGRKQESEADLIGLDLMARAGFEPSASIALWQNMGRGGQQPPEFMSTHPSHESRIHELQNRLLHANDLRDAAHAAGRRPRCQP